MSKGNFYKRLFILLISTVYNSFTFGGPLRRLLVTCACWVPLLGHCVCILGGSGAPEKVVSNLSFLRALIWSLCRRFWGSRATGVVSDSFLLGAPIWLFEGYVAPEEVISDLCLLGPYLATV